MPPSLQHLLLFLLLLTLILPPPILTTPPPPERLFAIQDPNSIPNPNPPTIPDLTISLTSRHTLISSHLATLHHLLRTLKSELQLQLQNQKPENLEMESARKEWQDWDWERETETIERVKGMLGEVLTLLWELEAEMEWWEGVWGGFEKDEEGNEDGKEEEEDYGPWGKWGRKLKGAGIGVP